MNYASKFRIIPYLSLSKDDVKLEEAYSKLMGIIKDSSINSPLKISLLEDIIERIVNFKSHDLQPVMTSAPVVIKKEDPPAAILIPEQPPVQTPVKKVPLKRVYNATPRTKKEVGPLRRTIRNRIMSKTSSSPAKTKSGRTYGIDASRLETHDPHELGDLTPIAPQRHTGRGKEDNIGRIYLWK